MTYKMKIFNYFKQNLYVLMLGIFIIGVDSFTPRGRAAHYSALIGNKLYFFGGSVINDFSSNEVFYLDVSKPFNFEYPPWVDLTAFAKIPFGSEWGTVSLIYSHIDYNPTIYLFGGQMRDPVSNVEGFISHVHVFNVTTSNWLMPFISGKTPERRRNIRAANDAEKIYIFGGSADFAVQSPTFHLFNEMLILDTISLTWSYGSLINAPSGRMLYSATMLSNGVIVYIGGWEKTAVGTVPVDINQIYLYDTKLDSWSLRV
jgi:N-acetylneuraminic acid mutarotase